MNNNNEFWVESRDDGTFYVQFPATGKGILLQPYSLTAGDLISLLSLSRAALAAQPVAQAQDAPEIVQRVMRFAGKQRRDVSNPCITANQCIDLANWIADNFSCVENIDRLVDREFESVGYIDDYGNFEKSWSEWMRQEQGKGVTWRLVRARRIHSPEASKPEQAEAPSDKDRADYWQGRAIVAERKLASHSPASAAVEREAQGRLILEASTGMHGDVAKQLAEILCAALATQPLEQKPVAFVDERAISWLASQAHAKTAHITTKLSKEKSFERPLALYVAAQPEQVAQDGGKKGGAA